LKTADIFHFLFERKKNGKYFTMQKINNFKSLIGKFDSKEDEQVYKLIESQFLLK